MSRQEAGNITLMGAKSDKELTVYLKAYSLAMQIFEATKSFPPAERWALTGQIRRSECYQKLVHEL
jgi:hypothetical protein